MSKKVLQCEYCRHLITENDIKCPNCGANCSNIIKKYKEEQFEEEKIEKEKLESERNAKQEQAKKTAKAVALGIGISSMVPIIVFIVSVVFLIIIVAASSYHFNHSSKNSTTSEAVTGTIEESMEELDGYTVSIDKYEFYQYSHKTFTDCNTKNGYQKIAFYFTIENTSDEIMSTYFILDDIVLKANNEVVSSASLRARDSFCDVVSGKEEYTRLTGTKLLAHDKVSGYKGFEVPKNAEKLKFIINNDKVIEIDNPAYQK